MIEAPYILLVSIPLEIQVFFVLGLCHVQEVMGLIPVWESYFFVPLSCHVDQFTFHRQ